MAFGITAIAQYDANKILVTYSTPPLAASKSGVSDALNISNYTIVAPHTNYLNEVQRFPDSANKFLLSFAIPLITGTYQVSISNVVDIAENALSGQASFSVSAVAELSVSPTIGGASDDSFFQILRRHIPKGIRGPHTDALLAALASGDKTVSDISRNAFFQLFKSTAGGKYLNRLSSDGGFDRPKNVGISDDDFRKLSIAVGAEKLTASAILKVLEVFYGVDSVRAFAESAAGTFAIEDGDTLEVTVDEQTDVTVSFESGDFADATACTSQEVAAALTSAFSKAGSAAYAVPYGTKVRVYSGSLGLRSSVKITGGKAQNALLFPQKPEAWPSFSSTTWVVSIPTVGRVRFATTSASPALDITKVEIGDYANVYGAAFNSANRGSFEILKVYRRWVSGTTYEQYFEVANASGVTQASAVQANETDLLFFNPFKSTPASDGSEVVVAQTGESGYAVNVPASTTSVKRSTKNATYPQSRSSLEVVSVERSAKTGLTSVTTANAHGFAVGEQVELTGVTPSYSLPANEEDFSSGLTSKNLIAFSELGVSSSGLAANGNTSVAMLSSGKVLTVGGSDGGGGVVDDCKLLTTSYAEDSNGVGQVAYSWAAVAAIPSETLDIALGVLADGTTLACGGKVLGLTTTDNTFLYDEALDSWATVGLMSDPRHKHTLTVDCPSFDAIAIGGEGLATVEKYTISTQSWTTLSPLPFKRSSHTATYLSGSLLNDILLCGGYEDAASIATNSCLLYNDSGTPYRPTGPMLYRRVNHAAVRLDDGRVVVIGGYGGLPGSATDDYLSSCEIYNPKTETWSVLPSMPTARKNDTYPVQAVFVDRRPSSGYKSKMVVVGPDEDTGDCLMLDCVRWAWIRVPFVSSLYMDVFQNYGGFAVGTDFAVFIGKDLNTDLGTCFCLFNTDDKVSTGGLSGIGRVESVDSTTSFSVQLAARGYASGTGGTATPLKSIASEYPSTYVFEPNSGLHQTSTESTTAQVITKGVSFGTLDVADASDFPDSAGWIGIAIGTKSQLGPIRYLGRLSSTALRIDHSYQPTASVATGASVVLLGGKAPYQPSGVDGTAYLTDTNAGRRAAISTVEDIAPAGVALDITIKFPGDRGLAGEGLPTEGANKLSDAVSVWGSNDLTEELATVREGI